MTLRKHLEELKEKTRILLVEIDNVKAENDQIKNTMKKELNIQLLSKNIDYRKAANYEKSISIISYSINASYTETISVLNDLKKNIDSSKKIYDIEYIESLYISLVSVRKTFDLFKEKISQLYTLFSAHLEKKNVDINLRMKNILEKNKYIKEILNKSFDMVSSDKSNLTSIIQKKPFLKLFPQNYRSKIKSRFNIGNKIIDLQVKSLFKIDDAIIGSKKISEHLDTFIDIFSKKSYNDQEIDKRIFFLLAMNDTQLQDLIISFINNTIIYIINSSPELIRASRANIYVGVYARNQSSALGKYLPASYYNNIFINIQLTETMLYYIFEGFEKMPNKSDEYNTIIHEFIHSYDWILNNPTTMKITSNDELYRATWSILGEEPYPETLAYAKVLIDLRSEGLAILGAHIKSLLSEYVAAIIDVKLLINDVSKNDELINFASKIYSDKSSSLQVLREVHKLYTTGSIHEWGKFMAWLILISKLNERIYFLVSEDPLPDKAIVELMHGLLDFDAIKKKYLLNVIKGPDLGDEIRKKFTKHIYIVMFRKDKSLIDQFITQLSLTNLDKFLEYYENALKFTNIPEIGISKGIMKAINKNMNNRLATEVKNTGFEWHS